MILQEKLKIENTLRKSYDILASSKYGWIQGHMALNEKGNPCSLDNEDACRWCVHGAILKASEVKIDEDDEENIENLDPHGAVKYFCDTLGIDFGDAIPSDLWLWNDNSFRTREEVLGALKSAMEKISPEMPVAA